MRAPLASLALLMIVHAGCRSMGPGTIPRDRFDYSQSMSESWKRQVLLNIVRLRYLDPPIFVDVGQIVAAYSIETGLNASGQFDGDQIGTIGGHATFTDRPTITYTPLTGDRFVRGMMTPIAPELLFYSIESGWPADVIMRMGFASVNGLRNKRFDLGSYTPADPKFLRVVALTREIQRSGALSMRIMVDEERRETKVISFRRDDPEPDFERAIAEWQALLGVNPDATEIRLVYGPGAGNGRELSVQTRSLLHILSATAIHAEVPAEHLRDGRVLPGAHETRESPAATRPAATPPIRCAKQRPDDAFVAVKYRDHWFWIDDRDRVAKRDFSLMMILFSLADTGEKEPLPLITIPAQ